MWTWVALEGMDRLLLVWTWVILEGMDWLLWVWTWLALYAFIHGWPCVWTVLFMDGTLSYMADHVCGLYYTWMAMCVDFTIYG